MKRSAIARYIHSLDKSNRQNKLSALLTGHLKLNAVYWAQTSLLILDEEPLPVSEVLSFVGSCECSDGGFSGSPGHDSHLLFSLSAIQVYAACDSLHLVPPTTLSCMLSLQ